MRAKESSVSIKEYDVSQLDPGFASTKDAGNPFRKGKLNTIGLLILTGAQLLILVLTLFTLLQSKPN
jgi:hypothetical protein